MICKITTVLCGTPIVRLLCITTLTLLVSACDWIEVASVSTTGALSNGDSETSSLSSDGRFVAFDSTANNLVAGDINLNMDVFVRDLAQDVTTRVSLSSAGFQGNAGSYEPSISADGRFVAFRSRATNLVPNDTNNQPDIFVRDRNTGTTTRVSVDSTGNQQNSYCFSPTISADGRFVTFESEASNLVPADTNNTRDIFVHDRNTGITTRVSVDSAGNQSNGLSGHARISGNGRYVAFDSEATNLVAGDTSGMDIFVHDRATGATTRVSVGSSGNQANSASWDPAISTDGRYVAFMSFASNLAAGDTNDQPDIFVRDRNTGTNTRVSVDNVGVQGNGWSDEPKISGDGRYVTFASSASNLVPGDNNDSQDIFIRDRIAGVTRRASLDPVGVEANRGSDEHHAISVDGRYVAIASWATNLVPDDVNDERDIFVRAIPHLTISSVSPKMLPKGSATTLIIRGSDFFPGTSLSVEGAKVSDFIIWNETAMTATVTVPANQATGAYDVTISLPGTGAGPATGSLSLCASCVTYF